MTDNKTSLPDGLVTAYRMTNFEVLSEVPFVLKVDSFSPSLEELFTNLNYKSACFITAYNPESVELSTSTNEIAQKNLHKDLTDLDCFILQGFGADPNGEWEGEPSYFALGITLADAKNLGNKYRQNAIVWCDQMCIPALVLLN